MWFWGWGSRGLHHDFRRWKWLTYSILYILQREREAMKLCYETGAGGIGMRKGRGGRGRDWKGYISSYSRLFRSIGVGTWVRVSV